MAIANKTNFTLDEFAAEMQQAADKADTLPVARDLEDKITNILYEAIERNYAFSSSASGQKWPPHAKYTIEKYGPHPLLILTGKMNAASTNSGVAGNYLDVTDRSITIGVDLPYAAAQQFGTDKIPARPFFDVTDSDLQLVEQDVYSYFVHEVIG